MKDVPKLTYEDLLTTELSAKNFQLMDCNCFEDSLTNYLSENKRARLTDDNYKTDFEYIYRIAQL